MGTSTVDLSGFSQAALDPNADLTGGGGLIYDPTALSEIPISGQLPGAPGGGGAGDPLNYGGFFSADPMGIAGVGTNPNTNPNPTGGWMATTSAAIQAAAAGFKAFSAGSPTVSIPRPRTPSTGILASFTPTTQGLGGFKWGTIAVIGVGVIALALLLKAA